MQCPTEKLILPHLRFTPNFFSFDNPTALAIIIPIKVITTPIRITCPGTEPNIPMMMPSKIGGIYVPNTAESPKTIAVPKEIPRWRIVKPPKPQRIPQKNGHTRVLIDCSSKTCPKLC